MGYRGHSVSARVGQDYPKSVGCLDGRSDGDVGLSAKTGSARFWIGLGTSRILIWTKMHMMLSKFTSNNANFD